ncbi:hypothetical protein ACGFSG_26645 [Streptomyces sp. NPDC048512]
MVFDDVNRHLLSGRRVPDADLRAANGITGVSELLTRAGPCCSTWAQESE